jgi:hypothetical protein
VPDEIVSPLLSNGPGHTSTCELFVYPLGDHSESTALTDVYGEPAVMSSLRMAKSTAFAEFDCWELLPPVEPGKPMVGG